MSAMITGRGMKSKKEIARINKARKSTRKHHNYFVDTFVFFGIVLYFIS